jgi:glutaminyl-tRNA synthetase
MTGRRRLRQCTSRRSRSTRIPTTCCIVIVGLQLLTTSILVRNTYGFAYAPNFITKIIEDQTSLVPQGYIQQQQSTGQDDDDEDSNSFAAATATVGQKDENNMDVGTPQVKTRFPPEPNGYLHLGHAKAISFNFAVARSFGGVCHMRLDDTNPSKEESEYVQSILEDVLWVQDGLFDGKEVPWDGNVRKTSDYFDFIYDCAVALIKSGDAYVDSLTADEMREYRGSLNEPGTDSPYRTRTVDENLQLFHDMKSGQYPDGAHVLRAKIAMDSPNMNMRDPTLYRIKHESHQETGDTWCMYPMYDFSHPIADAVEGITHSLCTLEFEDHRPFYDWTVSKLRCSGLLATRPQQIEFSRLNIKSTVLSKRKLIQLVQEKHVKGWDDPRLPTLSGLRRRGFPPAALRLFCERVGISKADSNIDYSVLEDCVRETMDFSCRRAFAILDPLLVTITNVDDDFMKTFHVDRHPKMDMGQRTIPFHKTLYIERSDFFDVDGPEGKLSGGIIPSGFKRLLPNGRVRLRYAYVLECHTVIRDPVTQEPVELQCTYFPETRAGVTPEGMERIKGIIHWVDALTAVRCTVNQYDRLFTADEPGTESGDFLKDINPNSLTVLNNVLVEPSVADDAMVTLETIRKQGDSGQVTTYPSSLSYQFERNGYFALDRSSTERDNLTFNRVVTLRDTWDVDKADKKIVTQRNRGGSNSKATSDETQSGNETIEGIRRVSIRAAKIISIEPHPDAENLLVCQVDCGDKSETTENVPETRTVVAGLAGKISSEQFIGRKVLVITNLKPAKMRGVESTAMLLAASNGMEGNDEIVELLEVPDVVPVGELVSFEGKEPSIPDLMLKSKGALKAWDRAKALLTLNQDGEAIYADESGSSHRMLTSGGPIRASMLTNAIIR